MPTLEQEAVARWDSNRVVFVGLGSNLADPVRNVRQAAEALAGESEAGPVLSSLWESAPIDCPPGSPPFVNAVAALLARPGDEPEQWLTALQALETKWGRLPKQVMNEPRVLDLDLILFGREERSSSILILPHPRAHQRRFVLEPLCELAPNLVWPGRIETVAQLREALGTEQVIRRLSG